MESRPRIIRPIIDASLSAISDTLDSIGGKTIRVTAPAKAAPAPVVTPKADVATQSVFKVADTLPTEAIRAIANQLVASIPQVKDNSFSSELLTIQKINTALQKCMQHEEETRSDYKFNEELQRKQRILGVRIDQTNKAYEKEYQAHQDDLRKLREELENINRLIIQDLSQATVAELRTMARDNRIHLALQDKITHLRVKTSSLGCCQRLFSCCCTPGDIQEEEAKIKSLEKEYEKLNTEDTRVLADTIIKGLRMKQQEVMRKLEKKSSHPPQKQAEQLKAELRGVEAAIALNASAHYHMLSRTSMIQCVRLHAMLGMMVDKITQRLEAAAPISINETTKLLDTNQQLTALSDKLTRHRTLFGKCAGKFYCPDAKANMTFDDCVQSFDRLQQATDKDAILAGNISTTLLDTIIPPAPPAACSISITRR